MVSSTRGRRCPRPEGDIHLRRISGEIKHVWGYASNAAKGTEKQKLGGNERGLGA